ncbi:MULTISPECIES: hypothetical protein [Cyanophyceae]|nr:MULTISPECIES: hypothetical protein [Cyanophyceae]
MTCGVFCSAQWDAPMADDLGEPTVLEAIALHKRDGSILWWQ